MSIVEFAYRGTVYLPATEVADNLGVPRQTFRNWCRAGKIPNDGKIEVRQIGARWFVTSAWFQSFLDTQAKMQAST